MYLIALLFTAFPAVPGSAFAQSEAILVNGEPITSYDVAQRTLWENRTHNFGERMKALLTGDIVNEKFRQKLHAANPRSQAEAQEAAARIKKELIEEAKKQVLSEGGATRRAVIEALIDDKLKLQEAKRLGIEITDGGIPGLSEYYALYEADGISRRTIQEFLRARFAWRTLIDRTYHAALGKEVYGAYESLSRSYLEKLRRNAVIEYRED